MGILEVLVFCDGIEARAALDELVWLYDAVAIEIRGCVAVTDDFLDGGILTLEVLNELYDTFFLLRSAGILALAICIKTSDIADTD